MTVTNRSSGWPSGKRRGPLGPAAIASSASRISPVKRVPPKGGSNQREADEVRQFAPHLLARFRIDGLVDLPRAAPRRHPRDRHRPRLRHARMRRGILVDQRLDIRRIEPQLRQRFDALSGGDRLGEEDAVQPACAGPGDDIDQHAQSQPGIVLYLLQQGAVYRLAALGRRAIAEKRLARLGKPPDLLRDAVHVDGEADAAIADQSEAQFLLAHASASPTCPNDPPRRYDDLVRSL